MPSDQPRCRSRSPSSYSRHHSSHRSGQAGSSSSSRHRSSRDDDDDRRRSHSSRSKSHRDRSRSRSPSRTSSPAPRRKRGEDDDEANDRSSGEEYPGPPQGVGQLDESDFYLKSNELRLWLLEQKNKRFDTLRSEDARRYFRKFINKWNRGLLPTKFYQGISSASLPTTVSSSHSWSFSKATQRELDDASYIRKSIDTGHHKPLPSTSTSASASRSVVVGPTMPPVTLGPTMPSSRLDALRSNRERDASERERSKALDKAERKKAAREAREEEKDGRATGRERQLEKKREFGEIRREIKEGKEPGMVEMNEEDLGLVGPGGGGSFAAAVAARDQGRNKYQGKKMSIREEKQAEMQDKLQAMRSKEDQTMALLKQMAAERFGPK
ncbi:BZ3500_MvSof-1268-A1-R1_Chr12-1g03652 [Microbotryum saponariae]|uniref:BZ3500_MvSof-1268-A1-R1_Chr12-1g03652 protein n=1 Tax=Microbotryum saponariae TaxID=289078 RepID=A0A2X0M7N3_9BASI|nr:BZ3500_MvSof-1268-A1-R1_Chr12-1g03652 [Microbotryum saponariae]SDA05245.1 BZ3501_MvSof-1269-A2-R1_Chr12-1g03229 [Microbotryum saponariae]